MSLLVPLATPSAAAAEEVRPAACSYVVYWVYESPVRENPDTDSVIRKYKYHTEMVSGPCMETLDNESGVWFTAVYCSCATDGIGWMRSSHLF
ncbi:MAG TPA: hypothetical protein VGD67_05290 [Pseudonocardiaceae bacterium]